MWSARRTGPCTQAVFSIECGTVLHANACDGWIDASLAAVHAFVNCSAPWFCFEAVCMTPWDPEIRSAGQVQCVYCSTSCGRDQANQHHEQHHRGHTPVLESAVCLANKQTPSNLGKFWEVSTLSANCLCGSKCLYAFACTSFLYKTLLGKRAWNYRRKKKKAGSLSRYLSKFAFAKCHISVSMACNRSRHRGVCAPMGGSWKEASSAVWWLCSVLQLQSS